MRSSNFMAFLDSLSTCVPVLFLVGRFHRVYEISFSPQTVRRNDTMEHVREELDRLIQQRRLGYSSISRMIGRNSSYIQQFIKRGSPRKLDDDDRRTLASFFGVDEQVLGGPPAPMRDGLIEIQNGRASCRERGGQYV